MPKELIKQFYSQYEPYLSPVAVLVGFVWDSLTLQRIDLFYENLVMLIYLTLVLFCILFLNAYDAGRIRGRIFDKIVVGVPFLLQVVFGGLFSAFFIFYTRSASIWASWPFILLLLGLLVGNELFRKRYHRFVFHISIYFITIFSYSVFVLPILVDKIGTGIFLLSGLLSLIVIFVVIFLIYFLMPSRVKSSRYPLAISIGSILVVFNLMYFFNVIPPIPLAMKDSGVYHHVDRKGSEYIVKYEPSSWYEFGGEWDDEFSWQPGEPVYNYTAVFAPTEMSTPVTHRWYFYSEEREEWVLRSELSYSMVGGRDGGYRGYSYKYHIEPGYWKVNTVTETGQILGSNKFEVVRVQRMPELKTKIK